ncbi:MAG: bifunctional diaminohydroxyphosphoribosylaminopyrimidine deaminase/5-amino-6-(5-phosphoribosylamino)uracil reductase RibD [Deltaproteobacteria bacterium]|nr:bifunctional diaminohydroxyphosphoribosylaminopyrimidine deaminase/5-amino-6-(5-phosphoribosylamino)uracil reductase RibD [Deltaproteobacteria bacterium]
MSAEQRMRIALRLARRARGRTWPNPMVGAVVVKKGRLLGSGYHRRAGEPHAEVLALDRAGGQARGADLYVTLEPCHCHGRTPPCTDRILQAGVRRVYVGTRDPNPRECGAGIEQLRRAGVEVIEGVLEDECRELNEVYNVFIAERRPFVLAKAAVSLDGRIAPGSGDARWISSGESRVHAHRLRASANAVAVGVGTVLADDPALNVRHVRGADPAVAVLDTQLRTPPGARLLAIERRAPVWIFCSRRAPADRARALQDAGAELVRIPTRKRELQDAGAELVRIPTRKRAPQDAGAELVRIPTRKRAPQDSSAELVQIPTRKRELRLDRLLAELLERGVYSLLVEGGARVLGAFLAERLVDGLDLAIAPCLLGSDGVPLGRWQGPARVSGAPRLAHVRLRRSGPDIRLRGELVWPEEAARE